MAQNTKLYRSTGSAWEEVKVGSDWSLIDNKPSTFTPTAHSHSEYLKSTAKAADSYNLGGQPASYYTNASNLSTGTIAAARIPSLAISKITDLQTTLNGKLDKTAITYNSGTLTIITGG